MKKTMYNEKIFLLLALSLLLVLSCSDRSRRDRFEPEFDWVFEGWACEPGTERSVSPTGMQCKSKNTLYVKLAATPSQAAIDSGDQKLMEKECRLEAATDWQKHSYIRKIISAFDQCSACGICCPTDTGCAYDEKAVRRFERFVLKRGIYNCCSMDEDTGTCMGKGKAEKWQACMCIGYLSVKGGRKTMAKHWRNIRVRVRLPVDD